jgi:magnesium chelatase family protein
LATQPCPCGYYTDPSKECTCQAHEIQRYLAKISGPLLDRIDLHIEVPAVKYADLASREPSESSSRIRDRVARARELQRARFRGRRALYANSGMQTVEIRRFCRLDAAGEELMKQAITKIGLSARAYDRILKVSRTIADLAGSEEIRPEYVAEAIQYRSLDRNMFDDTR